MRNIVIKHEISIPVQISGKVYSLTSVVANFVVHLQLATNIDPHMIMIIIWYIKLESRLLV